MSYMQLDNLDLERCVNEWDIEVPQIWVNEVDQPFTVYSE